MKTIEHKLTLNLIRRSAKDYFWNVSFKEKRGFIIAIGFIAFASLLFSPFIAIVILTMWLIVIVYWVKAYRNAIKVAEAAFESLEAQHCAISIDEYEISQRTPNSEVRLPWRNLSDYVETDSTLTLRRNKVPQLMLWKEFFDEESLKYVRSKVGTALAPNQSEEGTA